jgi:hypothetical protein
MADLLECLMPTLSLARLYLAALRGKLVFLTSNSRVAPIGFEAILVGQFSRVHSLVDAALPLDLSCVSSADASASVDLCDIGDGQNQSGDLSELLHAVFSTALIGFALVGRNNVMADVG